MNLEEKAWAYIMGDLAEGEKKAIAVELQHNALLVDGVQKYNRVYKIMEMDRRIALFKEVEHIAAQSEAKGNVWNKQSIKKIYSKILNFLGINYESKEANQLIFQKWFTPNLFNHTTLRSMQAQQLTDDFANGLELYNNQKFEEAIQVFNKFGRLHPSYIDGQFHLGNAYLIMNKPAMAIIAFEKILNQVIHVFHHNATQWLLSLAYIANGEVELARKILKKIVSNSDDRFYRTKAEQTLLDLKKAGK